MNDERLELRSGSLEGARVSVLGLGRSGMAAAELALAKGGTVYASDANTEVAAPARLRALEHEGVRIDLGSHDPARIVESDLIVASPGIPPRAPVFRELAARGRRWISEPELAVRFHGGSLMAVTGTNGKTTTAMLAARLLEEAGTGVALGGNVGAGLAPAASRLALDPDPAEWWVLELSSFQLAGIERLRPDVAVVTNLAPDHLDRYPDTASYYADKARLAKNADSDTSWVFPLDDEQVTRTFASAAGTHYRFDASGGAATARSGAVHGVLADGSLCVSEGVLARAGRLSREGRRGGVGDDRAGDAWVRILPRERFPLLGRHNVGNALAALVAASLAGADEAALARGLRSAPGLPHRLEAVAEREGVLWVNDSKATNLAAARGAITSLDRPIVLICGGKDKGEDLSDLVRRGDTVRAVIAMGEAGPRLARELALAQLHVASDLATAVARARDTACRGDCVLLSPACSSFDEFDDYAARGNAFRELVEAGP